MLCLLISLTTILLVKQTKSSDNLDIDYILKKLLASETFGKMADIIAERAVEKISSHLNKKTKSVDQDHGFDSRKDAHEFQNNINFSVINGALSNKTPVKSKLSLKYKLFTKRAIEKSKHKSFKPTKNFTDTAKSKSYYNIEGVIKETKNNISNKIELTREVVDYNEIIDVNAKNKKDMENKIELESLNDKNKKDRAIEKNDTQKPRKEDKKVKQIVSQPKTIGNKVLENVNHNTKSDSNLKNSTEAKHIYKEGNRVFALQSSSEYEDFHKEFNKLRMEESSAELS
ncbi:uncharacterized protein LOC123879464 [Maniola jurtina]|uniref:uncharacterized protein LOC123879464 n=1 Tax=Maniola jurtina TaxID=191418 RepID=UPI001E68E59E|nr:uncharacterized protein LOC123879464 [Maniola jurtina]